MNSNEPVNYGEIFCDAVDAIVSQRLADLKYDTTKICTIIDNAQKALGKYVVKEEALQYDAYSVNTTFEIGDSVIVLIPNGDYNSQKTILNKVVASDDLTSSVAYVSPLKSMINFVPNGIIDDNQSFSLLANVNRGTEKSKLLLYTIDNWQEYNNYKKIGISAKFQSWLKDLGTISGDYGLEFVFYNKDNQENNTQFVFLFNTNDILGNPYNFPTYFTQEKVIDISHLSNVNTLEIYFYQDDNFKDENNSYIISQYDNGNKMLDNLFVKDIKLYAGYDISEYNNDKVTLTTSNSLNYSSTEIDNNKQLFLHWVHKIDTNNYEVIDNSNIKGKIIDVHWVRYDLSASDSTISNIAGPNWIEDKSNLIVDPLNTFKCVLKLTEENRLIFKENIRIKAVCRIQDDMGNWQLYESDILTFTSLDERVDQTTYDAIMGLSLVCSDNSFGNYFIYNQNNELIDESQGQGHTRKIQILYDGQSLDLNNVINIKWTLPHNTTNNPSYTMLNYLLEDLSDSTTIIYDGDVDKLSYTISNYWYSNASNNTINCEVYLKNGEVYKASKELLFGKANSQGTNFSLILQYSDTNKNAYEVVTDNDNTIIEEPEEIEILSLLYNLSGQLITTSASLWSYELKNNDIFEIIEENSNKIKIKLKLSVGEKLQSNCSILKVKCEYKDGQTVSAYLPIAIKTKAKTLDNIILSRCDTMSGARKIIYNTMGYPNYYTDEYVLFLNEKPIDKEIIWELKAMDDKEQGYPELKSTANGQALSAKPVFIKDNNYKICVVGKNNDGIIYWIQPLLIMQSAYDFAIINDWNGTETISEDTSIITSVIAAGKKEDGTFSGIILGDIEEIEGQTTSMSTGLYGISKGIVTFQLTDKGQATFENHDSQNVIQTLLGDTNQILSHSAIPIYDDNGNETGYSNHFLIDIDGHSIDLRNNSSINQGVELSTGNPYLLLKKSNTDELLRFDTNNFIIQSPEYTNTSGLQFNVNSGIIKLPGANYISGLIDNDYDKLLKIGDLTIHSNGTIYIGEQTLEAYIQELIENAAE